MAATCTTQCSGRFARPRGLRSERLLLSALLSAALSLTPPTALADSQTWLFSGGLQGWTGVNGTLTLVNGVARFDPSASNPQLISPTISYLPATTCANGNYMRYSYRNYGTDNTAQFYFTNGNHGFSSSHMTTWTTVTNPPGATNWHYVTIPLANSDCPGASGVGDFHSAAVASQTTGRVTQIRIDPVQVASGGTDYVEIGFIVLRMDTRPPCVPSVDGVAPGTDVWTNGGFTIEVSGNDPPPDGANSNCTQGSCDQGTGCPNPDRYGSGVQQFEWKLGAGAWNAVVPYYFDIINGTARATLSISPGSLQQGLNQLYVRARDRITAVGTSTGAYNLYFDSVVPGTPVINYVSPGGWTTLNTFDIGWTNPGDNASGIDYYQYSVDGGPSAIVDGNFLDDLPVTGTGQHTVAVRAVDNAGNVGAWSTPATLYIDNAAPVPVTVPAASPTGYQNTNAFSFTWNAATDAHSGLSRYEYRVNSGPISFTSNRAVSGAMALVEGANTFYVRAVDNVGNTSNWGSVQFFYYPHYLFPPVARTPADGASVSLPETFSWDVVPNATGYELQIGPQGNFSAPWSTTTTTLTSVVVPATAAPASGSSYAWRVRALGSNPPSPWGNAPTFVRVSNVAVPGLPALAAPGNDALVPGTEVTFQWLAVTGATSYRLEVSTDPAFGAGAASSWVGPGITGTSRTVEFSSSVADLYWRVSAANSAGFGAPSLSRHLQLVAPTPGLLAAEITSPASDASVDLNQPMLGSGLIVGRASETVLVEWLLDGLPYFSENVSLAGAGAATSPAPIPTGELGTHVLQMRVTGSSVLLSPARTIDVGAPGYGEPDNLVLVADEPQLLVGQSTALYCTVRDLDGSIVLNDTGRLLRFDASEGGTVNPVDASTLGGVATTVYVAPADEAAPSVHVEEVLPPGPSAVARRGPGLPRTSTSMGASSTELRRLQSEARAYLARLENLSWDNVEGMNGAIRPRPFRVGYAEWFVASRQPGDESRLRRLNQFLRFVDRSFYHDQSFHRHGPKESARIFGAASMMANEARSIGRIAVSLFSLSAKLDKKASELPWYKAVTSSLYKGAAWAIVNGADLTVKTILGLSKFSDYEKNVIRNHWDRIVSMARAAIGANRGSSIADFVNNTLFTTGVAKWMVDTGFTDPMERQLDAVVSALAQPGWSGGSDARAIGSVSAALSEYRGKTAYQHRSFKSILGRINWLAFINDAQSVLAHYNAWLFASSILNKFVQNLILWASGVDCGTTGLQAAAYGNWVAAQVLAFQSPFERPLGVRPLAVQPAVPERLQHREALVPTAAHAAFAALAEEHANDFEAAARTLEHALADSDTVAAAGALQAMLALQSRLFDDLEHVSSPVYATMEAGQLQIEGAAQNGDSLAQAAAAVANRRHTTIGAAAEWLDAPTTESLRLAALDSLRVCLEDLRSAVSGYRDYAPTLLGTAGAPFLVIDTPTAPGLIPQGVQIAVEATVHNLGAGTAENVWLEISGPDNESAFPEGTRRSAGDIPAGGSATLIWLATLSPTIPDGDSTARVYLSIKPDSASALGGSRSVGVTVSTNPNLLSASGGVDPNRLEFVLPSPNPGTAARSLRFALPYAGPVILDVYDLLGRRIKRADFGRLPAGPHVVSWDGRDSGGHLLRPGVYMLKLRASGDFRVRQIVVTP